MRANAEKRILPCRFTVSEVYNPPMVDMQTVEHWLETGLAAAHAGDHAQARALLLQVVNANDQIEVAWLALADVLDDPDDQQVALENALALNPLNFAARDRLEALRANPTADQHATDLGQWQNLIAKGHTEDDDGLDDPLQCPACGQPTAEEDKTCPHCRQKLLFVLERPDNSEYLQRLLLWQWAAVALAVLACAGPVAALANTGIEARLFFTYLNTQLPLSWLLGEVFTRPADLSWLVLWVLAGRVAIHVALALAWRERWPPAYYAAYGLLPLDMLVALGATLTGSMGVALAVPAWLVAGLALIQLPACERDFISEVQRVYTQPDTVPFSAADFHLRGHHYRQAGLWALAVAQWRRAVGLAPREARYYKDLGIGLAHIKRYQRSLRALEQAAYLNPHDPTLAELQTMVRQKAQGAVQVR